MEREEVLEALNSIFRNIFDDEAICLSEETTSEDIDEWDSIEHINIIFACERRWKIEFDVEELSSTKNIGDLITIITIKVNRG